jgi:uncharacterized protein DUF932
MQAQTIDLLASAAPAALGHAPKPGLSNSYAFLPTRQVVEALLTDNWAVVEARQTRAKRSELNPYKKHEIILADRDQLKGQYGIFSEVPRVILSNSHDGAAQFRLSAGLWVCVCSNGLVTPDGLIQSIAIRHSHRTIEEVVQAAQAFRSNADLIGEHVASFKARELSTPAAYEFARQALALRSPEYTTPGTFVALQDVLALQRREDAGNSLWKVFNRTQEHLLKGGFPVHRLKADGDWQTRRARAIHAIDESSRLNKGLWSLAEQFSLS